MLTLPAIPAAIRQKSGLRNYASRSRFSMKRNVSARQAMAFQADMDRRRATYDGDDVEFPAHTARGAGRPLLVLAAVVGLALVAWIVFTFSYRFIS
jgi:hypothetical protein